MPTYSPEQQHLDLFLSSQADPHLYHFQPTRREVVQLLGAGILIAVASPVFAQQARGGRGNRGNLEGGIAGAPPSNLRARLHIAKDGTVTVLCGKVECGQGIRAEVTQAAAEELHCPASRITVILADTDLTPNDGATVGSQSTPRTIPPVRQACAAARELLTTLAARTLAVPAAEIEIKDGRAIHGPSRNEKTYADLAAAEDIDQLLAATPVSRDVAVSAIPQWQVLGAPFHRPNAHDIVTGTLTYPSDVVRPGMLYGKVLRALRYRSKPSNVDLARAKALPGVTVVQDGDFIGVTAPTSFLAQQAVDAITVQWQSEPHPASATLADHLVKNANPPANPFNSELTAAAKSLKQSYFLPYVQHAPMEPRAAVAEWSPEGKLTVWTATQQPFGVRQELANTFRSAPDAVHVIVPDFGGGFGGKHTGECAVEAARLAKAAGKPVHLRWTRGEEFMWAYFRPAGVMQCQASLDASGRITSWYFININSGPSAVQTPYAIGRNLCQTVNSQPPLRHGSYRGLAATANAWARECFMEELAAAAGKDSLDFRLTHITDDRLRNVLATVAKRFDWQGRSAKKTAASGLGIACATEKGSYTATAAQVTLDKANNAFTIDHLAQVFESGKIVNPYYLNQQVAGAMIQGLGPILREAMEFEDGRILNDRFADYHVPRFSDVPSMDVFLLDRPDLPSAGAGETPLISVAPAITNALSSILGTRLRELPLTLPEKA